jgi:hypothetical protein
MDEKDFKKHLKDLAAGHHHHPESTIGMPLQPPQSRQLIKAKPAKRSAKSAKPRKRSGK